MNHSASIPAAGSGDTAGRSARGGAEAGSGGSSFEAMLRGQVAERESGSEPSPADGRPAAVPVADAQRMEAQARRGPSTDTARENAPRGVAGPGNARPGNPPPGAGAAGLASDPDAAASDAGTTPGESALAEALAGADADGVPGTGPALDPVLSAAPMRPVMDASGSPPLTGGGPGLTAAAVPMKAAASVEPGALAVGANGGPMRVPGVADAGAAGDPSLQGQAPAAGDEAVAVVAGKEPAPGVAAAGSGKEFQQMLELAASSGERGAADAAPGHARGAAPGAGPTAPAMAAGADPAQAAMPRQHLVLDHTLGTPGWDAALGARMVWSVSHGVQAATLALNPHDLGPVNVQLRVQDDEVSITFVSQHAAVREAVEAAMPRLRELLAADGLDLGAVQISADSGQAGPGGQAASGQADGGATGGGDGEDGSAGNGPGGHAALRLADGLVDTFA